MNAQLYVMALVVCTALGGVAVLGTARSVPPQDELPQGAVQARAADIRWVDAPPPFPKGSMMAVLAGNPRTQGAFVTRFKLPANFLLSPHFHSTDECVTVLAGTMNVGFGDTPDRNKATPLAAGSFYINPSGVHHYVFTGPRGATIQINGQGPWTIEYVNSSGPK